MPTLEVLENLKSQVNQLGDEPRIRASRGETIPDVLPPEAPAAPKSDDSENQSNGGGVNEMEALLNAYSDDLEDLDKPAADDWPADEDDAFALEGRQPDGIDDAAFGDLTPTEDDDTAFGDLAPPETDDAAFADLAPTEDDDAAFGDLIPPEADDTALAGLTPPETDDAAFGDLTPPEADDAALAGLIPPEADDAALAGLTPPEADDAALAGLIPPEADDTALAGLTPPEADDAALAGLTPPETDDAAFADLAQGEAEGGITGEPAVDGEIPDTAPLTTIAEKLDEIPEISDISPQFSLDDFGDEYNFSTGSTKLDEAISADTSDDVEQKTDDFSASKTEESPFTLGEDGFLELQKALTILPRNLKLVIERFLGDDRWDAETIQAFVDAILAGESPKELAARYYGITKRKIKLSRRYKRQSGKAFEERQSIVIYQVLKKSWPPIRQMLLIISTIWILGMVSFMWVYRPLKAEILYSKGLKHIAADEIDAAVETFHDAWDGWPIFVSSEAENPVADASIVVKGWKNKQRWLEYARELRKRKYWEMAERFYDGYLAAKPDSTDVRIEYGRFLSGVLGKYESAILVLETIPGSNTRPWNQDLVLTAGDVYLDWAEDDPVKYEDARLRYAEALERSRDNERAILSMMRYHLKLQDREEIETLLPVFYNEVPGKTSAPELAANVYAGLAEFHLAEENMKEASRFMDLAESADPMAPEPFFIKAQYWRAAGNEQAELSNYQQTLINLDGKETTSRSHIRMRILSLAGIGHLYTNFASRLSSNSEEAMETHGLALDNYHKAVNLYQDARSRNLLGASPEYGVIFLELGDSLFQSIGAGGDSVFTLAPKQEVLGVSDDRIGQLRLTEQFYNQAEELLDRGRGGSNLPDRALYRRAYARYLLGMDEALIDFHRVTRRRPNDYDSRLALGAVLLDAGDYEASRIQYARSIELMDEELSLTGGILEPEKMPAHQELLIRYAAAWNNLGVGRARSATRGGGNDDYAAALSAFTMASEYLDKVYTDSVGLISRGAVGMRDQEDRRVVERFDRLNFLKEKAAFPYRNRLRLLGKEDAETGESDYLTYPDIPSDLRS